MAYHLEHQIDRGVNGTGLMERSPISGDRKETYIILKNPKMKIFVLVLEE